MTITLAKWSLADYHQMIAAHILVGRRVELLNGEIVKGHPKGQNTPRPAPMQQTICGGFWAIERWYERPSPLPYRTATPSQSQILR